MGVTCLPLCTKTDLLIHLPDILWSQAEIFYLPSLLVFPYPILTINTMNEEWDFKDNLTQAQHYHWLKVLPRNEVNTPRNNLLDKLNSFSITYIGIFLDIYVQSYSIHLNIGQIRLVCQIKSMCIPTNNAFHQVNILYVLKVYFVALM